MNRIFITIFCSLAALCLLAGGMGNRVLGYRSRAGSMEKVKTKYERVEELVELPYFELDGHGRIALAVPGVAPIIDAHTHLALSYLRSATVDLMAEQPRTRFYLPMSSKLDLDVYAAQNFELSPLWRMKMDLSLMSVTSSGLRRTHTAPNMISDMTRVGIAISLLLPIDMPALSRNAESYLEIAASPPRLASLGSVHPFASDRAEKLEWQRALGALGIKLHPRVQVIPPAHPRAIELYKECADLGLPVLWHCGPVGIEPRGGRQRCQVRRYVKAVKQCPRTCFILGHSGALQMEQALEIARDNPNIYMELSSQSLSSIRRIIDEVDPERILFGSDWPLYHQAISLSNVLIATEGRPRIRRMVLRENAERLFGLNASVACASRELPRP